MVRKIIGGMVCGLALAVAPFIAWAQGPTAPSTDGFAMGQDVGGRLGACMKTTIQKGIQSGSWRTLEDAAHDATLSCGPIIKEALSDCRKAYDGDKTGYCKRVIGAFIDGGFRLRLRMDGYGPDYAHQTNGQTPLVKLPSAAAGADDDTTPDRACTISRGDPIDKVRRFYKIPVDPQWNVTPSSTYQYHLAQYGVWVFFDRQMHVSLLRFEAPFRGRIGGIALGDTANRVHSLHGDPTLSIPGMPDVTSLTNGEQHVAAEIAALPDTVPKSRVLAIYAELNRIQHSPLNHYTAWIYRADSQQSTDPRQGEPRQGDFVRYEIGPDDNRVHMIFATSCSKDQVVAGQHQSAQAR